VSKIALTLGPVLFYWPTEKLVDFYRRIADEAPVDRVHIGETVCGKRMPFTDAVWPEIIERLERGGKQVVLSTLAAPATTRERRSIEDLCGDERLIEVNDVTALRWRTGRPFVTGPFLNVYNEAAVAFLGTRGAETICPPVELAANALAGMAKACPDVEFEIFAFGRLPLAISGRCYHARMHGLHKDSCRFMCEQDTDGLAVDTLDDQKFLAINGVQTLSSQVQALCMAPDELHEHGIARLRLSPHTTDMVAVAKIFRDLLDGRETPGQARFLLSCLELPGAMVDGFAFGAPGCRSPEAA